MNIVGGQIKDNAKSSSKLREINQVFNDWVRLLLPKSEDIEIRQHGMLERKSNYPGKAKSDAVFIGWQETSSGATFPLYNITIKNHPLYQSTVSDQTLRNQNLKIPQTPFP
jgi:hypothetical protein